MYLRYNIDIFLIIIFFFKFSHKDFWISWSTNSAHCTAFYLGKVLVIETKLSSVSINSEKVVMPSVVMVLFDFLSKALFAAAIPSELGMLVQKDLTLIPIRYVSSGISLMVFNLLGKSFVSRT